MKNNNSFFFKSNDWNSNVVRTCKYWYVWFGSTKSYICLVIIGYDIVCKLINFVSNDLQPLFISNTCMAWRSSGILIYMDKFYQILQMNLILMQYTLLYASNKRKMVLVKSHVKKCLYEGVVYISVTLLWMANTIATYRVEFIFISI